MFLRLGCTCFGGPVAHIGYFRAEFVDRRRWLSERAFADLVALCQFLPGPASSQTGFAVGLMRGGLGGGIAAWLGFTLPSAAIMVGFAYGVAWLDPGSGAGWLHGLKLVAAAAVAQAAWAMGQSLCPDRPRAGLAIAAAMLCAAAPLPAVQMLTIALGAGIGWAWYRRAMAAERGDPEPAAEVRLPRGVSLVSGIAFAALLAAIPLASAAGGAPALLGAIYRAGALVFGGGHVVLPLLESGVADPGWVSDDEFLAGYGVAQAVPGPLFTFGGFLGAAADLGDAGAAPWLLGALAIAAIFLPGTLLILALMPHWSALRDRPGARAALAGANAAVVGILAAALYDPIWTAAVTGPRDFAFFCGALGLLIAAKLPPWLVVIAGAAAGGWLL